MKKEELCIMPNDYRYSTKRFPGAHRHEVFFGPNRQKSIDYGLVIFLTPEMHNMSNAGIHFNKKFDNEIKKIGQRTAMKYYNWSKENFIRIFGRNYID